MYKGQAWLTLGIWAVLLLFGLDALITGQLSLAFISFATLGLAMAPAYIAKWAEIHVPRGFIAATTVFVGMTLFLGEVYDFYDKYWWWDMVLHFGSAVGFGMIGFVLVFMMFQGRPLLGAAGRDLVLRLLLRALGRGALGDLRIRHGPDLRHEHAEIRSARHDEGPDGRHRGRADRGLVRLCLSQEAEARLADLGDPRFRQEQSPLLPQIPQVGLLTLRRRRV
jgi:hypothetical protein